jgi:methionyl aminopeptidase
MQIMEPAPIILVPSEISKIEKACRVVAECIELVGKHVQPGVQTAELDSIAEDFLRSKGGQPAFKGYVVGRLEYPHTLCVSIDEEVVHGMPSTRTVKEGQLVSVDVGVQLDGYFGDSAYTFAVGSVSPEKELLIKVTQQALQAGIAEAVHGNKVYDIAKAVQSAVESNGFSVVRELVGHGIGKQLHEEPPVPNFVPGLLHRSRYPNARLKTGMALAIEPMVNAGSFHVHTASDGWTIYTADGKPSAHFEHTVVVQEGKPLVLTQLN